MKSYCTKRECVYLSDSKHHFLRANSLLNFRCKKMKELILREKFILSNVSFLHFLEIRSFFKRYQSGFINKQDETLKLAHFCLPFFLFRLVLNERFYHGYSTRINNAHFVYFRCSDVQSPCKVLFSHRRGCEWCTCGDLKGGRFPTSNNFSRSDILLMVSRKKPSCG